MSRLEIKVHPIDGWCPTTAAPRWVATAAVFALTALLLGSCPGLADPIPLAGEQDGFYEKGEYLVSSPVVVPAGKQLSFAPGTVVRFERYTGLTVEGILVCEGTAAGPIVFTSASDSAGAVSAPARFDWNGIRVEKGGGLSAAFLRVSYGTAGIEIADSSGARKLENLLFHENGGDNLTIGGALVRAEDNKPFTFTLGAATGALAGRADAAHRPVRRWKKTLRLIGAGVFVGGAAMAIVGFGQSRSYFDKYRGADDANVNTPGEVQGYRETSEAYRGLGIAGVVIGALGAAGVGVTVIF